MALNTFKYNCLTPLHFKGLRHNFVNVYAFWCHTVNSLTTSKCPVVEWTFEQFS